MATLQERAAEMASMVKELIYVIFVYLLAIGEQLKCPRFNIVVVPSKINSSLLVRVHVEQSAGEAVSVLVS